jgi:hypothetical protein
MGAHGQRQQRPSFGLLRTDGRREREGRTTPFNRRLLVGGSGARLPHEGERDGNGGDLAMENSRRRRWRRNPVSTRLILL